MEYGALPRVWLPRGLCREAAVPYFESTGLGWHTWTVEEVRQYGTQHPLGPKARLALDLLLYTGVRRSAVVTSGRPMIRDGWLRWTESKAASARRSSDPYPCCRNWRLPSRPRRRSS